MQETIRVVKRGVIRHIEVREVSHVKSHDKYSHVRLDNGETFLSEESLGDLVERFYDELIRIHRNCAVSRTKVNGLVTGKNSKSGGVVLIGRENTPLLVSRRYGPTVRAWARGNGILTWKMDDVESVDGSEEACEKS